MARSNRGSKNQWTWVYLVLCLAILGFLGWILWSSSEESLPPTTRVAIFTPQTLSPAHEPSPFERVSIPQPSTPPPLFPPTPLPQPPTPQVVVITNPPPVPRSNPPPVIVVVTNPPPPPQIGPRPVENILEAQIAMARSGISSGSIDGRGGSQTRSALQAFQKRQHIPITGALDAATRARLLIAPPVLVTATVTSNDLQRLITLPQTWVGKSELPRLDYENILELLGERAYSNPKLIRELNPSVNWNRVTPGTRVQLPNVEYPAPEAVAAFIQISLQNRVLEAFDADTNLLAHFPCSIGHIAEKRPVGALRIEVIIPHPNYTFNPEVFPESEEARTLGRKLVIPAGPNNPVGVAWMGLNRPGYGIHGTPGPEQVGRTESHGCFRLANWNAEYLMQLAWVGMPVIIEP